MPVTLTTEQRNTLRSAVLAYKAAFDAQVAARQVVETRERATLVAFEAVLAAATIGEEKIEVFRWGPSTYRIGTAGVYESENIVDLT